MQVVHYYINDFEHKIKNQLSFFSQIDMSDDKRCTYHYKLYLGIFYLLLWETLLSGVQHMYLFILWDIVFVTYWH